ncbi:LPXTG cell wall anchor domain-containing protein [Kibdelosporangium philippinense]|uniref:LPXTG cell wall anchor domain-containing protein n=1 Tax=Kibdelosporangium philippinense TaxID=211113 RepID=A0ABS8ZPT6_9PSEU|nr:SdrD B-like domain-containing protein [Kibdelosporangium philippinense]MCE7009577.1 LPXTG cell wall anchor domain-containing protein [Kibdelosporangium philippinense]
MAVTGLLILGSPPAFADPTDEPSGSVSPSASPTSPEAGQPKDTKSDEPTAKPAEPAEAPDLELAELKLKEPTVKYPVGAEFVLTGKINNRGKAEATEVKGELAATGDAKIEVTKRTGLDPGLKLAPQSTKDFELTVKFTQAIKATEKLTLTLSALGDTNTANDKRTVDVVVSHETGTLTGRFFLDQDGNGKYDAGDEGVSGVVLKLGGPQNNSVEVTTGPGGAFSRDDLPVGKYTVAAPPLADGWVTAPKQVDLTKTGADVQLFATRPLSEVLKVTAKFNEGPYQARDKANLTITLVNGKNDSLRVVANCEDTSAPGVDPDEPSVTDSHLEGSRDPKRWGKLVRSEGGVEVKAGETKTVSVEGSVPLRSYDRGVVHIYCAFEAIGQFEEGAPKVLTLAKVAALKGYGSGYVFEDRDGDGKPQGEGIKGLGVSLVDPFNGNVVATTTTKDDGSYKVENVESGWYIPVFKGPWKSNVFLVVAADGFGERTLIPVVPGPAPGDGNEPAPMPKAPPGNNNSGTTPLAKTGANVIGLTIGGLAVLLVGIGAVVFTRKRRRS